MITIARKIALLSALTLGTVGVSAGMASAATAPHAAAPQRIAAHCTDRHDDCNDGDGLLGNLVCILGIGDCGDDSDGPGHHDDGDHFCLLGIGDCGY